MTAFWIILGCIAVPAAVMIGILFVGGTVGTRIGRDRDRRLGEVEVPGRELLDRDTWVVDGYPSPATTDETRANLDLALDRWPTPTGDPDAEVDPAALRAAEIDQLNRPGQPPLTDHERDVAAALIQARQVDDRRTRLADVAREHEPLLPVDDMPPAALRARVWEWDREPEPINPDGPRPVNPWDAAKPGAGMIQRVNGSGEDKP